MKYHQDHEDNHITSVLLPFHVCTFWFPLEYEMKVSPAAQTTSHHITKTLCRSSWCLNYTMRLTHTCVYLDFAIIWVCNQHLANCERVSTVMVITSFIFISGCRSNCRIKQQKLSKKIELGSNKTIEYQPFHMVLLLSSSWKLVHQHHGGNKMRKTEALNRRWTCNFSHPHKCRRRREAGWMAQRH